MKTKSDVSAGAFRQSEEHVLFVEGEVENSVDAEILKNLFWDEGTQPSIKPMGKSSSIKSVAESLHPHHPTYYFLIDRDHHDDAFVQKCWEKFPDPNTFNLLVWRKKEIENYFLDIDYISQSSYCKATNDELSQKMLTFANERIFLDVVNRVIVETREKFKEKWVEMFDKLSEFPSREIALQKLLSMTEFETFHSNVENGISQSELKSFFNSFFDEMSGGKEKLEFDCGNWIDKMSGKAILTQLINSNCFVVSDAAGKHLQGRDKFQEVIKDLLRNAETQPDDFRELKKLITERINGAR